METKVIFSNDISGIKEAGKIISGGGLVVFPTETVYGIGADGLNENAIKSIYKNGSRKSKNATDFLKKIAPVENAYSYVKILEEASKMS